MSDSALELYGDILEPGALAGSFAIDALIARGGFACVYRATHLDTGAPAALKVLRLSLARVMNHVRRFRREAATLRALAHPHVVEVLGAVDELIDGRPFIALEWLPGGSLRDHLDARGPVSVVEAVQLLRQVGSALAFAHQRGVVHRDLKAENVLLGRDGDRLICKLADFGIARPDDPDSGLGAVTSYGRMGTRAVMAPEQLLGRPVDARTDVYALGALAFHVLTGRLPFATTGRPDPSDLEDMHLHAPRPRASQYAPVPDVFDRTIARAMAVEPDDRYPEVAQFLADLQRPNGPADDAARAVHAVAVYAFMAGADTDANADADADADADSIAALERLCDALEDLGMELVLETADSALAAAILPAGLEERALRERVLLTVVEHLDAWTGAPGCRGQAMLRVGPVTAHSDGTVAGGPLLAVASWPTWTEISGPGPRVHVDREFARDLPGAGIRYSLLSGSAIRA